jgi:ABC-2 type transport system permease protein
VAQRETPGWSVIAGQELRDLWLAGRGLPLAFAFSVLVSVISYLAATNKALNFLEQREAVNLTVQAAVAVGALLALLAAADAVSGERERGTLESLLLTPLSRSHLLAGKLVAALSLWAAAVVLTVPFVWFLGRGVEVVGAALATGIGVGTLLAVALTGFAISVSALARSNRVSLSICLFVLLALFAPTQLPTGAQQGWVGELLLRVNPITAGEHYIAKVVIDGHGWAQDAAWLVSPIACAVAFTALALVAAPRLLTLGGGSPG